MKTKKETKEKREKREKYSKADFLKEITKVFKLLDRPFTRREYDEVANIHSRLLEKRFGSWNNALRESGLIEKFKGFLEIKKEIKDFNPQEKVKAEWKEEKENLVKKAEERQVKWMKNHLYKMELLQNILTESISKAAPPMVEVQPLKIVKLKESKNNNHVTLWFEFSDLQLGTNITSEEMGGINKHNWIIWQEKLKIWTTKVIEKIARYQTQYIIDHVIIAGLGDFVEGVDIFKGQEWKVDKNLVDQTIYGANDTAAAFIEIFLTYPDINFQVLEVFGNHGRIGRKGEQPYSCSMDKVYLRMIEMQLRAVHQIKNYTWHQNEAWFYLINLYGWNHLLLHGDQGMGGVWSSRPTINGLEKGVVRWSQMLQQHIHFLHIGHFHQEASLSFNRSNLLINGSFIGTSDFAAKIMVASSIPTQVMHVFEPNIGLSQTERIYLTETKDNGAIEPIKPGLVL